MAALVTARRSRRYRWCREPWGQWAHDTQIRPGDLYAQLSLPPHGDIGNTTWWHDVACRACAENEGHGDLFAARDAAITTPKTPATPVAGTTAAA